MTKPREPDELPEIGDAGDDEEPCANCLVTWPPDALDPSTGFCPDCVSKYQRDRI